MENETNNGIYQIIENKLYEGSKTELVQAYKQNDKKKNGKGVKMESHQHKTKDQM